MKIFSLWLISTIVLGGVAYQLDKTVQRVPYYGVIINTPLPSYAELRKPQKIAEYP